MEKVERVEGAVWVGRGGRGARGHVPPVLAFVIPARGVFFRVPISDEEPELLEGYGAFVRLGLAALGAGDAGGDVGDDVSESAENLSKPGGIQSALSAELMATREADRTVHQLETDGAREVALIVRG